MTPDPVATAVDLLGRRLPALAGVVLPEFEANARKAVERHGLAALHTEPRKLSLLTALDVGLNGNLDNLFTTLDRWAGDLGQAPNSRAVIARLAECEGRNLLSTVSELALAVHLKGRGAAVAFNQEYVLFAGDVENQRDVDIVATWPWGTAAFEVYSPRREIRNTSTGWIDLRPRGLADQVATKAAAKFGAEGDRCDGLPSDCFKVLAVDVAYNERAFVGVHSPLGKLQEEMESRDVLGGADAALFFTHVQHAPGLPVHVVGMLSRGEGGERLFNALAPK